MLLGRLLEYINGLASTVSFMVFIYFNGFWLSYGASLLPFFNTFGAYLPTGGVRFFVTCMAGWYSLLFIAVDFLLRLSLVPHGGFIKVYEEKKGAF